MYNVADAVWEAQQRERSSSNMTGGKMTLVDLESRLRNAPRNVRRVTVLIGTEHFDIGGVVHDRSNGRVVIVVKPNEAKTASAVNYTDASQKEF